MRQVRGLSTWDVLELTMVRGQHTGIVKPRPPWATQPGGGVRELNVTVAVMVMVVVVPHNVAAQGNEMQVVDRHQDWRVVRYEDPFGENSGSAALNGPLDQSPSEARIMAICYDGGVTGVSVMIPEFAGMSISDSERRTVKYTTPEGAVGTAEFLLVDSSIAGSNLFLARRMNLTAWEEFLAQATTGEEIYFRIETSEGETADYSFSLMGFTAAWEQACG